MADLNPLKFQVAIQDDATGQLNKIEQEFQKLRDKTISVKVEGLSDLQNLLSALQHKQVETLGKDVAAGIQNAAKGLQEEAQKAVRASLGQLAQDLVAVKTAIQHDNFSAFTTRIEKCAEAVNTLDAAFKQFHVTIGSDAGMKNFMTGLGEVIRNVRTTMGTLQGSDASKITPDAMARSFKVAKHEVERLQNELVRAQRTIETFGDKGFNVASLERYKMALLEVRDNLDLIKKNGGMHPLTGLTASQYLSQEDVSRTKSLLNDELSLYRQIGTELERMTKLRNQLSESLKHNPNTSYGADIKNFIAGLDLRMGLVGRLGAQGGLTSMKLNSLFTDDYREQLAAVPQLLKAVTNEQKNNAQATKQAQSDNDRWAESIRRASVELPKLEMQIKSLQSLEKSSRAAGIDTTNLSAKITELQNLHRVLESIAGGAKLHGTAGEFINSAQYQNTVRFANEAAAAVRQTTIEKEKAARASQLLSSEEQRLAQALNHTTQEARSQSQVLSDLKSMATQYLSVWGASSFVHSIIETGGLLEQQRLSIGAILGDVSHANELFSRIKGLAVQSPFGVVELDRFSKQLTAYNFQYNELYDMTKRLADVSAATGTDVSRLALALGHVRSEGALTGYTLRQFAMNNVPMLTKLSERLSEIEGRVVTAGDVRNRVRNKEISYKDVESVIKELTDEGGMFYNAQEVMSQALNAKFKNLRDSFDIMFGEIAESGIGDILKDVAVVMTNMSKNWQVFIPLVKSGALGFALYKTAVLAANTVMGQHLATTEASVLSYKKKTAEELKLASITRQLTNEEKNLIATSNALTASDVRVMMSVGALEKSEVLRLITLKKLTAEEAKQLVELNLLTEAELKAALGANRLSLGLKTVWASMKSGMLSAASFVFNGWNMAFAALTAYMELSQHNAKYEEERAARLDALNEKSQEGLKNLREMTQTYTVGASSSMDNNGLAQSIDEMVTKLKDYSVDATKVLNDAFATGHNLKIDGTTDKAISNVHSLSEQYEILAAALRDTEEAYKGLGEIKNLVEDAYDATKMKTLGFANPFDNDLKDDIKEYSNALKEYDVAQVQLLKHRGELNQLLSEKAGVPNASQLGSKEILAVLDNIRQNSKDVFREIYQSLDDGGKNAINSWTSVMGSWRKQLTATLSSASLFGRSLYENLVGKWGNDMNKWPQTWEQQVKMAFETTLANSAEFANMSIAEQDRIRNAFLEPFGIKVDNQEAKERINEVIEQMNALVGKTWVIKLGIQGVSSMDDITSIENNVKKYRSTIEKLGKGLSKKGYIANGKSIIANGPADLITMQDISEYNDAVEGLRKAESALSAHGLSLPEEKKSGTRGGKKTGGTKSYKDEFAKRWDERIRIMKEAHDWYRKWEKEVGHEEAIKETFEKYQDIFKEWKEDKILPLDFDVNDIDDFQKYVEKIYKDALDRYNKQKNNKLQNYGQEAQRVYRQAAAVLEDIKFDNFKEAAEEFRSIIDQTIEDLNERWDIFDAVRNATGNVGLATRIAGFGAAETGARTSADAMRNELQNQLRNAGGEKLLSQIPLDVKIDEEGLRTKFENAIPQGEDAERYKEKIDGLIKAYQEWQKLQKKVIKDDVNVFANLIGSTVSYDAQIKKIRSELSKKKASIANAKDANGKPLSQADKDKATDIAQTQADWEEMKLSADYANIYNNAIAMSREEFNDAATAIKNMLDKLRELGLISPEDYISERGKLDKARNEWSTTGFLGERGAVGQYISGGYDGLKNYYAGRWNSALQKAEKSTDPAEKKKWEQEVEHYGKLFDDMSKLSDAAKDVITAFNTLQSGLDLLGGMFDSLGMEGAANATSDAAGVLGGAMQGAQSLSALGPWGMAAGAALGLVSGIAQTHDKALERQIGKLREDVQKIEANTKLIEQARERTLGFDTGDLRRSYAQDYAPNQTQDLKKILAKYPFLSSIPFLQGYSSKAQKDMYEYYNNNSAGSGYQQEYKNLLDQRKDYLEILDKQESKKKKSQSDIEETKSKIAELDDQIRYFTQDLAKELFDIDIKGWADQLSDALSSAFENGESMAKAYKETVTSILQQVMNKMMQMAILEPMFQSLQDKLFGNAEKNISGVFDPNDPKGSMGKVTAMITDFFGKGGEGEKTITAAQEFMTAFQRGVQNAGLTVLNESSKTLSSGIQGTSEETSDLLAGYINALRQDVAINRIVLTQFISEMWPSYIQQFSAAVTSLNNIDTNVSAIRALISENGALYIMIDSMRLHLDNITNGFEQVSIK